MGDQRVYARTFEAPDGAGQPVSAANEGSLRYNDGAGVWESSVNGGPWTPLGGGATPENLQTTLQNTSGVGLIAGSAVFANTSGTIGGADKASTTRRRVIGLATAAIADTASGAIATSGALTLTTAEWDAVTGGEGGLVAGRYYYLDSGGLLTGTPTTTVGEWVVEVGIALSTTQMLVQIKQGIFL